MTTGLQPSPETGSYGTRRGNEARIYVDGQAALGAIFDAIEKARRSVWVTVSFVDLALVPPGRNCSILDVFAARAAAGIDVRLLFWWSEYAGIGSFRGDPEELAALRERNIGVAMRWDCVPKGCHHQKSYVVDDEVAFVGGINLTREALSRPEHDGGGFHDLFAELRGPVVADVAHNFVQRWNQATETIRRGHVYPSPQAAGPLPDPSPPGARKEAGARDARIERTIRHGLYRGRAGWPGEAEFDLSKGDAGVRHGILEAIGSARRTIYIENQFLMDPQTISALGRAASRGVEVVAVVPLEPDRNLLLYPAERMRETRAALAKLGECERVGLFGLARREDPEQPIYVHSKLLIADDERVILGSANLWPPSYWRDSELNVFLPDPDLAADLRLRLWREHGAGEAPRGLADWIELGQAGWHARQTGAALPSRIVAIRPAEYYVFPDGAQAPWEHLARPHVNPGSRR
ncbi:MAG: phosphatidylserine/phosphatidylglycerophosphate/cardiolipin synthase family protein [Candidatus Dadabacteria bacterium]|nr:MAG: phosphatidylserine/phosphatidylglycerophosphate/cardiolipin synthase family protein [Candidatus Dadabacteria bacterium]